MAMAFARHGRYYFSAAQFAIFDLTAQRICRIPDENNWRGFLEQLHMYGETHSIESLDENPTLPPMLIEAANKVEPDNAHTHWEDIKNIVIPLGALFSAAHDDNETLAGSSPAQEDGSPSPMSA